MVSVYGGNNGWYYDSTFVNQSTMLFREIYPNQKKQLRRLYVFQPIQSDAAKSKSSNLRVIEVERDSTIV